MAKHWDAESRWPTQWRQPIQHELLYEWRNTLPPPEDWMIRGACVGKQPGWDRSIDGESEKARLARQREAARICRTACPVLRECRAWSERVETIGDFGVVGGRVVRGSINSRTPAEWVELGRDEDEDEVA